jgi:hypothetical protein
MHCNYPVQLTQTALKSSATDSNCNQTATKTPAGVVTVTANKISCWCFDRDLKLQPPQTATNGSATPQCNLAV